VTERVIEGVAKQECEGGEGVNAGVCEKVVEGR